MPARPTTIQRFRARQKARGLRRFEVQVPAEDGALVRQVAAALADPQRRTEVRAELVRVVGPASKVSLKKLLIQGPSFDDLDLSRSRETGRAVEL